MAVHSRARVGVASAKPRIADDRPRPELASRLTQARRKIGLSQQQLASKLGVSAGAVGQWEIGQTAPKGTRLRDAATALGISVDALLGHSPAPDAPALAAEDAALLATAREAREFGIDLDRMVAEARQRRWQAENREALEDANAFLERHGLWSDGRRLF